MSISLSMKLINNFVPKHDPASRQDFKLLLDFLKNNSNILTITGAGISTESGIPDYRSEGVGLYSTSPNRPIQFKNFMTSEDARQRYWLRNYIGWPRFSSVQPNITHTTLTAWQKVGTINHIVTQNVDRLHFKAGSESVTELHGSAYRVKCMSCSHTMSRYSFQQTLAKLNKLEVNELPVSSVIRPDGDVELDKNRETNFKVPVCDRCSGILKPDVVFFGETVPASKVNDIYSKVEESQGLLVCGSSLMVFSAYRFVLAAVEKGKPVAIINIGPTRADNVASLKINARCGDILPRMKDYGI